MSGTRMPYPIDERKKKRVSFAQTDDIRVFTSSPTPSSPIMSSSPLLAWLPAIVDIRGIEKIFNVPVIHPDEDQNTPGRTQYARESNHELFFQDSGSSPMIPVPNPIPTEEVRVEGGVRVLVRQVVPNGQQTIDWTQVWQSIPESCWDELRPNWDHVQSSQATAEQEHRLANGNLADPGQENTYTLNPNEVMEAALERAIMNDRDRNVHAESMNSLEIVEGVPVGLLGQVMTEQEIEWWKQGIAVGFCFGFFDEEEDEMFRAQLNSESNTECEPSNSGQQVIFKPNQSQSSNSHGFQPFCEPQDNIHMEQSEALHGQSSFSPAFTGQENGQSSDLQDLLFSAPRKQMEDRMGEQETSKAQGFPSKQDLLRLLLGASSSKPGNPAPAFPDAGFPSRVPESSYKPTAEGSCLPESAAALKNRLLGTMDPASDRLLLPPLSAERPPEGQLMDHSRVGSRERIAGAVSEQVSLAELLKTQLPAQGRAELPAGGESRQAELPAGTLAAGRRSSRRTAQEMEPLLLSSLNRNFNSDCLSNLSPATRERILADVRSQLSAMDWARQMPGRKQGNPERSAAQKGRKGNPASSVCSSTSRGWLSNHARTFGVPLDIMELGTVNRPRRDVVQQVFRNVDFGSRQPGTTELGTMESCRADRARMAAGEEDEVESPAVGNGLSGPLWTEVIPVSRRNSGMHVAQNVAPIRYPVVSSPEVDEIVNKLDEETEAQLPANGRATAVADLIGQVPPSSVVKSSQHTVPNPFLLLAGQGQPAVNGSLQLSDPFSFLAYRSTAGAGLGRERNRSLGVMKRGRDSQEDMDPRKKGPSMTFR